MTDDAKPQGVPKCEHAKALAREQEPAMRRTFKALDDARRPAINEDRAECARNLAKKISTDPTYVGGYRDGWMTRDSNFSEDEAQAEEELAERDESLDLIADIARFFGCDREWSNLHDHHECVRDAVSHSTPEVSIGKARDEDAAQ
jgi:hypothetical protein